MLAKTRPLASVSCNASCSAATRLAPSQPSFKFNAMRDDAVLDDGDDDAGSDASSDVGGNGAPENCVTSCQATMHAPQAADGGMQKAAAPPFCVMHRRARA